MLHIGTEEEEEEMSSNSAWPENVGIVAMELYFPRLCVAQSELEQFDGVSTGKYTIGLGQEIMGFCTDREDVYSVCLTVTQRLFEKHHIDPGSVGRLEVGTESLVDKSKSVKSVLMQLFEGAKNFNLEGVDSVNACFGGTQALFNAVNWIESSSWDGRFALVVMGDIAVYAPGPARSTGGAGAIALLLGPDAPLVFERGLRALHVRHTYDFYKPKMDTEYPFVDGQQSVQSYLSAIDACYKLYAEKCVQRTGKSVCVEDFDAALFHSPYCKLVQKSLARLAFLDFRNGKTAQKTTEITEKLAPYKNTPLEDSYLDKDLEKLVMSYSERMFETKTKPSLTFARRVGNMYTPSLYGGLVSYLLSQSTENLLGKRLLLFSYGSGKAAAMFSMRVREDAQAVTRMRNGLMDARTRLEQRRRVPPAEFAAALILREKLLGKAPYTPQGAIEDAMFPGTYYLQSIDEKYRRTYGRTEQERMTNGLHGPESHENEAHPNV